MRSPASEKPSGGFAQSGYGKEHTAEMGTNAKSGIGNGHEKEKPVRRLLRIASVPEKVSHRQTGHLPKDMHAMRPRQELQMRNILESAPLQKRPTVEKQADMQNVQSEENHEVGGTSWTDTCAKH
jgi:hypothetical protein